MSDVAVSSLSFSTDSGGGDGPMEDDGFTRDQKSGLDDWNRSVDGGGDGPMEDDGFTRDRTNSQLNISRPLPLHGAIITVTGHTDIPFMTRKVQCNTALNCFAEPEITIESHRSIENHCNCHS